MKKKIISLLVLALGLAPAARSQTTPPVLIVNITDVSVTNNTVGSLTFTNLGQSYSVDPTISFTGGGGKNATATAHETNGSVDSYTIVDPGMNYIGPPTVTFSGGMSSAATITPVQAVATANLNVAQFFNTPYQNEAYGPTGETIGVRALASGTQPKAGFTYNFTVNGLPIGETPAATTPGEPAGVYWTPPLPGVYNIVANTSDGLGNTAISAAIRYFAFGTAIVAPEAGGAPGGGPGSIVPIGSAVVVQATSTPQRGFITKIDFYTDWNGTSGTLIGTATNYPYSVIYSPAGPSGSVHVVKAIATDNNGDPVPETAGIDQITLTMTTANTGPLPTCTIVTPISASLVEIPNYKTDPTANIPILVTAGPGAGSGAHITKVEVYVNGVLTFSANNYPYSFAWQPTVTGAFALTALAYDSLSNVVASSTGTSVLPTATTVTVDAAPAIAIISPGNGAVLSGSPKTASVTAVAVDTNLDTMGNATPINLVQFYQDGVFVGSSSSPDAGTTDQYTISFKPTQNIQNGMVVDSSIVAIASDKLGFTGTSNSVNVTVSSGGGSSTSVEIGIIPTITLVAPTDGESVVVNNPTTLSATADAPNGNVAQVEFLVDNVVLATVSQYPYSTTWTPHNLGHYQVTANVTDNLGDEITSHVVNVVVTAEAPPKISITSPSSGGTVTAGSGVTITAGASSQTGTISQVQFFENGLPITTVTSPPYTASFTPMSAGVYTITAVATDSAGETTTSAPSIIEAEPAQSGLGTTAYFGQYQGLTEGGRFAFITVDGKFGTYIGHATSGGAGNVFYPDLNVTSAGAFSGTHLSGTASASGVSGNLIPSQDLFIGAAASAGSSEAGYYTGNLAGQPNSVVTAIVGGDGSIMVYVSNGTANDIGDGAIDSTGAFSITTTGNNTLNGTVSPTTALLTGTLTGPAAGSLLAGKVDGGTFSDGVLRNLSTRGQVGTGGNLMVAGFVVGGTAPKHLLVRAVGPALANYGLAGALSSATLQVFSGTTLVASNTGWSSTPTNTSAVTNADTQVGAFALPAGSADSALVADFAPGLYTAQVTGGGGATGLALAEVYDLDSIAPFTAQRLINVSTRGYVGTGNAVLIAGFSFNGTAPKRLLIRGIGPALSGFSVANALSAAHLQIFNSAQQVIRENFSWQTGNDAGLVTSAASATGAFALANGSPDSAILITLPPGTYTAEVSGATTSDVGVGMVEVYEVP